MPSRAESANAIANTPQIPNGPSRCKTHAVYLARMCPMVFKTELSFRTSVLCAVRNLGEPREASHSLRRNNRAFGSLPYRTTTSNYHGRRKLSLREKPLPHSHG